MFLTAMEFDAKLALSIAFVVFLSVCMIRRKNGFGKADRNAPSPCNMISLIMNYNQIHDFLTYHNKRYRTFRVSRLTFDYIYTAETANIEHILKNNFSNYGKGMYQHEILKDLLGDGIFTVDGERWKEQRKRASLEFSTKILRDFSSGVFREKSMQLCRDLMAAYTSQETVELQSLLLKSTMNTICKVGFGIELDKLSENDSGASVDFACAFDNANSMLLWRYIDPFWKIKRFFNIGSEAKLKENVRLVDSFLYPIIQKRCQEISMQQETVRPDILSRFIALGKERENKDGFDKYLRDVVLNFIIAGRDTTAITLCWFLYSVCKKPEVEAKILQEIDNLLSINGFITFEESIKMFSENLTYSVLDKMHYLHAALSETLRLFPAVPLESKYAVSNDILPDGTNVRKGDCVFYSSYSMGRMTYLWGSDAEEFILERWLDDHGIFQSKSPFLFTAFQAGPRICLGKDFAYMQMKIVAAFLLYFFKFELVQGKPVCYEKSLTLHMSKEGLNLHIKPRLQF